MLAGVLGALAVLAHGGAVFAVVGLIPWAVARLGKRGWIALLVLGAIYAPWFAFQHVADPPGDRLIKWHFAGTDIDTRDDRNPLDAITSSYRDAGLDVFEHKLNNLRVALGDPSVPGDPTGPWTSRWNDTIVGTARSYQLTRIVWAPGVLLLGLFFGWRRVPRTVWLMLAAWLAAYVLLEWGGSTASLAWLHTAPMCLVVGWVAVCALASPRWMLPVQGAVFVGMWFMAPSLF